MTRNFSTHVDDPLCIESPGLTIDATGTYCACTGALLSVRIGALDMPVHQIEAALAILAPCIWPGWSANLCRAKLEDLNADFITKEDVR